MFGLPESVENVLAVRKEAGAKRVADLLKGMKLEMIAKNHYRVGSFKTPEEGESLKPRPMKIEFDDHKTAKHVMTNKSELRNGSDEFKNLIIEYDASKAERDHVRSLVNEAKKKSENCPNGKYKVRGPPWDPKIKLIEKKNQGTEDQNLSQTNAE